MRARYGETNVGIAVLGGSPIISGNFLTSHIVVGYLLNSEYSSSTNPFISDNILSGGAIQVFIGQATIQRNYISENIPGIPDDGIPCGIDVSNATTALIQNNTITNNSIGVHIVDAQPSQTITGNNIENNSENSISSTASGEVTASYNWFGTTDPQAINQSLNGPINVSAFLTEPNPEAMPNPALVVNPINASVENIASSADPSSTTVLAATADGSTVAFALEGNVTSQQMSNVTITDNSATNETQVSFTLTGENGTVGFCNMTIPVGDVPYGTTPVVFIDNATAQNQGYTCDGNNYHVWFTTHFSTHQVSITFAALLPLHATLPVHATPKPTASPPPSDLHTETLYSAIVVAAAAVTLAILLALRRSRQIDLTKRTQVKSPKLS